MAAATLSTSSVLVMHAPLLQEKATPQRPSPWSCGMIVGAYASSQGLSSLRSLVCSMQRNNTAALPTISNLHTYSNGQFMTKNLDLFYSIYDWLCAKIKNYAPANFSPNGYSMAASTVRAPNLAKPDSVG